VVAVIFQLKSEPKNRFEMQLIRLNNDGISLRVTGCKLEYLEHNEVESNGDALDRMG
jgi:hypothetical protein